MLILKKGNELSWFDLLNIESPLMAKRTIQSNHGNRVGSEIVHNANEHGLPSNRATSFDPYGVINDKLDNGQVFLVNNSTSMPVIKRLDVTSDNTAQWELHHGQNLMFLNAMDAALHHVQLPGQYSVLRSEPAHTSSDLPVVQNNTREKHIFLFNAKAGTGEVLPESHAVLMVVLNSTKNTVPVKQQKDIISDAFSRTITAEQGDSFKVYAIQEHHTDLKRELNSNNNLNSAEASNNISVLRETHAETRTDGVVLHHMEYTLPVNPELTLIRIKQTAHTTIGELSINTLPGKKWYVLEPGGPDSNKGGGKRIPIGEYPLRKYTSKSFPGEYEISGIEGRSKIIMYEYEKSKGMMPGLCPGMSFDLKDGDYLVGDSVGAKKEIYDVLRVSVESRIIIQSDLSLKILKDKLWTKSEELNLVAFGSSVKEYGIGGKSESVGLIQKALDNMNIPTSTDGAYGGKTTESFHFFQRNYPIYNDSIALRHKVGKDDLILMDKALIEGWEYEYSKPNWIDTALKEIGVKEDGVKGTSNAEIEKYYKATFGEYYKWKEERVKNIDDDEKPWCACFVTWVMDESGYGEEVKLVVRQAFSLDWREFGKKVKKPTYGTICIKKRARGGHIGFVVGESGDGKYYYVLGGNQNDEVNISKSLKTKWDWFVVPSNYKSEDASLPLYSKDFKKSEREL